MADTSNYHDNMTDRRKYTIPTYTASPHTTWPSRDTLHSQIPNDTATVSPTSQYNMADTRQYITSRLTTWPTRDTLHTQIPIYTASALSHTSEFNMIDTKIPIYKVSRTHTKNSASESFTY
jgi:hypothetical protein